MIRYIIQTDIKYLWNEWRCGTGCDYSWAQCVEKWLVGSKNLMKDGHEKLQYSLFTRSQLLSNNGQNWFSFTWHVSLAQQGSAFPLKWGYMHVGFLKWWCTHFNRLFPLRLYYTARQVKEVVYPLEVSCYQRCSKSLLCADLYLTSHCGCFCLHSSSLQY